MTSWISETCAKLPTYADDVTSKFYYPKFAVIRSKKLKIPQIVIAFCSVALVLCYELIYNLRFMRLTPLAIDFHPMMFPALSNFWECSSYSKADCVNDIPEDEPQCHMSQTVDIFDVTAKKWLPHNITPTCRAFDHSEDVHTDNNRVDLSTRTVHFVETKSNTTGVWDMAPGSVTQTLTIGAMQVVGFGGLLFVPAQEVRHDLFSMQGFLQFANEDTPRRIQCSKGEGPWQDCGSLHQGNYWKSRYPNVASLESPGWRYNDTGCGVYNSYVRCHVSTLLEAAGINHIDKLIDGKSPRNFGVSLQVHVEVTNMDGHDFWSFPWGSKPKYVISVTSPGHTNPLPIRQSRHDHGKPNIRERVDHFGIALNFQSSSRWGHFDPLVALASFVVAITFISYSRIVVNYVVLQLYYLCNFKQIYKVFRYNVFVPGPSEDDLTEHTRATRTSIDEGRHLDEFESKQRSALRDGLKTLLQSRSLCEP